MKRRRKDTPQLTSVYARGLWRSISATRTRSALGAQIRLLWPYTLAVTTRAPGSQEPVGTCWSHWAWIEVMRGFTLVSSYCVRRLSASVRMSATRSSFGA